MAKRRSPKVHSPQMPRKFAASGARSTAINRVVRFALKADALGRKLSRPERDEAERRFRRAKRKKARKT